jgi:hypothetical protein
MKALLWSVLFPIISVISLIPLRIIASVTTCTTCATHDCNKQSIWNESIISLRSRFLSDEHGHDLIRCGTHYGVYVHQLLQEDFALGVLSPRCILASQSIVDCIGVVGSQSDGC